MDPRTAYLQKHQIPELVDGMIAKLLKATPTNPKQFIADLLIRNVDGDYPPELSYPFRSTVISADADSPTGFGLPTPAPNGSVPAILPLALFVELRDRHTSTGCDFHSNISDAVTEFYRNKGVYPPATLPVPPFPQDYDSYVEFGKLYEPWICTFHGIQLLLPALERASSIAGRSGTDAPSEAGGTSTSSRGKSPMQTSIASSSVNSESALHNDNLFTFTPDFVTNRVKGGFSLESVTSAIVRLRRNVKAYRLSPGMSRAERRDLARNVFERCSRCVEFEGGEAYLMTAKEIHTLPVSMQPRPSQRCASASREWPDGRGVFVTQDHLLAALVGHLEEHLEIVSVATDGNVRAAFEKAYEAAGQLEKELKLAGKSGFTKHKQFGFVTGNPSFIGSGLTIEVAMEIPKLCQHADFKRILAKYGLTLLTPDDDPLPEETGGDEETGPEHGKRKDVLGDEVQSVEDSDSGSSAATDQERDIVEGEQALHSNGTVIVRNTATLKVNEWQQLQTIIDGCAKLAELERRLEGDESIVGKW